MPEPTRVAQASPPTALWLHGTPVRRPVRGRVRADTSSFDANSYLRPERKRSERGPTKAARFEKPSNFRSIQQIALEAAIMAASLEIGHQPEPGGPSTG